MNNETDNLLWYTNPDADAANQNGALKDLAIAVRPNFSVSKWPSNAGSKALENYRPIEDAAAVRRLRENGARLIGMSQMSELGFGIVSETSHKLISSKTCNAVLGTDALGESRYLSTLAGAWGYKPSFGICPNPGIISLVPSMESPGIIANDLFGIKAIFSALNGNTDHGRNNSAGKIGVITEQRGLLSQTDKTAFDQAMAGLTERGIVVKERSFPNYPLFQAIHQVVGSVEASSSAGKYDSVRYGHRAKDTPNWNEMYIKSRQESFGTLIKSYLFQGAYFQFQNYAAFDHACRLRNHLTGQFQEMFDGLDFIASPVRFSHIDAGQAKTIQDVYTAFALTLPANVTGMPSLSIPTMVMAGDADLGLQLTGARLSDHKLLAFAETLVG